MGSPNRRDLVKGAIASLTVTTGATVARATDKTPRSYPDLEVLSRDELVKELNRYGFESPTGAPFADALAALLVIVQEESELTAAREVCETMESQYQFYCEGGPLTNVSQWIELRRRVGAPGAWG